MRTVLKNQGTRGLRDGVPCTSLMIEVAPRTKAFKRTPFIEASPEFQTLRARKKTPG
jgi:hypothetical protein